MSDAQGNVLSIYRKSVIFGQNYFFCEEQTLYGSARLGTEQVEHSMRGLVSNDALTDEITRAREQHGEHWQERLNEQYDGRFYERLQDAWGNEWSTRLDLLLQGNNDAWLIEQIRNESYTLQVGTKRFELSNHLGNVLAVVSDKKVQPDGVVWQAEVVSAQDYFPFGMAMPGRTTDAKHRYGFNGKETDPETGIQDYGMRWYLPNIARFPSVDPLTVSYPWYTPYQFAGNMPIQAIDLDGAEPLIAAEYTTLQQLRQKVVMTYANINEIQTVKLSNVHGRITVEDVLSSEEPRQTQLPLAIISYDLLAYASELASINNMSFKRGASGNITFLAVAQNFTAKTTNGNKALTNTYLHVIGQTLITMFFGRSTAQLAGHLHELDERQLLTGVPDPKANAVYQGEGKDRKLIKRAGIGSEESMIDNYCDLVNNQWGQLFGEAIAEELKIPLNSKWSPEMTANVLNKLQEKLTNTMGVQFSQTYKKEDEFVKKLTFSINEAVDPDPNPFQRD